ncbi:MAG TPA: fumarylacetoacetate hydrolase family protein [Acidimicrobiales bacterium]|nr:fumarylacetoacetate hydrolase family protein [Acidimicrobiales bacterium]
MRLATIRIDGGTRAVRIDGDEAVDLDADDVGIVLQRDDWRSWAASASGVTRPVAGLDYAPLIPRPDKIICVGLNYKGHIAETGAPTPEFPILFAKYRASLVGANDDVVLPAATESDATDYEAELAVIIGRRARRVSEADALDVVGGYAVCNDVSVRDYQRRTTQFLQGKTWERSTPLGPWLVTPDESPGPDREITCEVNGEQLQKSTTADLLFDVAAVVSYASTIITLEPGDVIATGTPSGVGMARTPPRWLQDGDVMVTRIEGLGECRNTCRRD